MIRAFQPHHDSERESTVLYSVGGWVIFLYLLICIQIDRDLISFITSSCASYRPPVWLAPMRLEKIKIAGFKSFVDPTTVLVPSNLVGVIGPNGCGKSNVIDAVRWVMGESSAKMLRGESMADVIFNGSTSRKPVGMATVELVFDNAEGRAGGQFAAFSQISVKRRVTRDGQSSYFLNGAKCRRRDITDLFLGTGLGPRSYSIIEQGMISRIIEAKPEELRVYLEEAAGISKYKERRRETENRIRHTRENLERLHDLREEVAKQLQHLERQAATAEKYQRLKDEERRVRGELLALRWRRLDEDVDAQDRRVAELENRQQAALAEQRRKEADIEAMRVAQIEANDRFNEVQARFYAIGSEIAKLEQAIQFSRETRRKQQSDFEQITRALHEARDNQALDNGQLEEINTHLLRDEPLLAEARAAEVELGASLATAEQAMQVWQNEWDEFNHGAVEPAQTAQVERTRINHLEEQDQRIARQLSRLGEERERMRIPGLDEEIADLAEREAMQLERLEQQRAALDQARARIVSRRDQIEVRRRELDQARGELQTARGRLASLEALQEAALGNDDRQRVEWLERSGLGDAPHLAASLRVEPRWQLAVETVLGSQLQALCVDDMAALCDVFGGLSDAAIGLFERHAGASHASADSLAARVESPWPLDSLLGQVRIADTLEDAFARRATLRPHESLITPDGVWLGPDWLKLDRGQGETDGVLAREAQMRELQRTVAELEEHGAMLAGTVDTAQHELKQYEDERAGAQRQLDEVNRLLGELRSTLSARRTRREHLRARTESLDKEIAELHEQAEQNRDIIAESRAELHQALVLMETLGVRRDALSARREALQKCLRETREALSEKRNQSQQIALRVESMRASAQSLSQSLERMGSQLGQLERRHAELKQLLAAGDAPIDEQKQRLEEELQRRLEIEAVLAEARDALEQTNNRMREAEQQRHQLEQVAQEARATLTQAGMQRQEAMVRCQTVEEQLREAGHERDVLLADLPDDAKVTDWEERARKLDNRIQRLGAINLAAIEEFKEQSERLDYLDSQHADVSESLETLESAIRKIDKETRLRFKETYDKVNAGIKEMFPKLFGGGHAYLELTGEDLLETGVTVMARPPGKRNSSIYLLSGGEKALTAVSLVFSIFRLNPSPFCMLDEVDAPLDDANVGRFCDMVKAMSESVQFIFITHNKVTMEMANQLSGVTMHEPGVSRLVSVDVDEAVQLAVI